MRRAFYEGFKYVCGKYGVDPIPLFKAAATAAASTPAKSSPAAGAPKGTSAGAAPSAPRPAAPKPATPEKAPTDPFTVGGIEGYRLGRQGKTTSTPVVSKPPASPQTKAPAPVAKPVVKTPQAAQPAQTDQKPPTPQARPYHWQNANGRNFQTMDEAKFLEEWRKGTAQQRNKAMSSIGVNQKMWEQADDKQRMLWRRQAADSYYARNVRNAAARAARNANFGVHPNMAPSQNMYRPDPENPGFAVNAYGQRIAMNDPTGSLLGNSPYAVAGRANGRQELNGLFYVGQNNVAPGTTILRQPRIGMA